MFPDIAGLRRNLFRKATGRHPKNLRAHPSSKTGALSVRGKSVNPISAIGILNYKQHACNYKRLQGGLSIAKARVFVFLLRGRCSRSARFAAGAAPYSAAVFLPIRRFHFRAYVPAAINLFRVQAVGSFSGVYSQKYFNRISKNARLWAYAADVENLSFQQYPYFFQ